MFRPNKVIKSIAFVASVLALSLSLSYLVSAWTEPTANPPTPNVSAPLNIGSTGQSKAGGLILNTGGAPTGLIVSSGAVNLPANSIDSSEVGFNYAGSASKGGAASNVVCTNCITLGVETSGSYVTSETDPTVLASVKDGITWLEIASRPPGLDDGDQVGITSETDPTVLASVKDGITWTEIASRPPGLDDGDQVGITSETDPTVPASVKDGISWGEVSGRPAFNGCAGANLALKTLDLNTGATTCETDDIGAGGITGSGTANYISKWTGGTSLGNSIIYDNGFVGIGTAGPGYKLDVVGDIRTSGTLRTNYVEASTAIGGTTVNAYSQL